MLNLDQGLPDPRLFPVELLRETIDAVLRDDGTDALRYYGAGGPSEMRLGSIGLRTALADRTAARTGRSVTADCVMLANGSTDGLAVAVKALLGPGDGAVVEAATYRHTRTFMRATGAVVRSTPIDDAGIVIDELERTLDGLDRDGHPARLIYTIPTFQSPTGSVLPLDRRVALVELASRRGIKVLEDNCYYEFGYDRQPPPTLFALDTGATVVHSDSFSKYVAPGVRIGWVVADPDDIEALSQARQDFSVSQILARTMERFVVEGHLDRHIATLRGHYQRKCERTTQLLREHCGQHASFNAPQGGFFFWLTLHGDTDAEVVTRLLAERGVGVRTGEWFTDEPFGKRRLRLSPIQLDDDQLERGITILGEVLATTGAAGAGSGE
ncbi:MAG TPA: PLP-dependent aminotransferase family protein [Ilumatobacter sp.]|nr:PLP-dependent aminotransferase family protein [Ilumatobacter sp.]